MAKPLGAFDHFGYLAFAAPRLRFLRDVLRPFSVFLLRLPAPSKMVKTLETGAVFNFPLPGWPRLTADMQFLPCFTNESGPDLQKPVEFEGSGRPSRRRRLGLLASSNLTLGQLRAPRPPDGFDLGQFSASRGKNDECPERFEHFPLGRRASENGNRPKRRNRRQV